MNVSELNLPPLGTNINEWLDSQLNKRAVDGPSGVFLARRPYATDSTAVVTTETAADLARQAALMVITDKQTLILNLANWMHQINEDDDSSKNVVPDVALKQLHDELCSYFGAFPTVF